MGSFSVTLTKCLPCCTGGDLVLSCRTRGGTASLCGYPEWVSPSTPPKRYLTLSQGGSYSFENRTNSTCATVLAPDTVCTWSGSCSYNPTTCVLTSGGRQNCGGGPAVNCGNLGGDFAPGGPNVTTTQTRNEGKVTGICIFNGSNWGKYSTANQFAELSDEDTDANAIARLLAGGGGTWSAYKVAVLSAPGVGQCVITQCCRASWAERTSGITFAYQEAGFKVEATGLTPSTNFTITMDVYRSLAGAGAYSLVFQSAYGITTDGSGNYTLTDDVPILEGYDTFVTNPVLT